MPLHFPKHSWYTLNDSVPSWHTVALITKPPPRCSKALDSLSASVFVMSPHEWADIGRIPVTLSTSSCSWLHLEQKICNSSQTWFIWKRLNCRNTLLRTCGRQSRFSPPTTKHEIVSPSRTVSESSLRDWSGVVRIGSCWIGKGGGVMNTSPHSEAVAGGGSFFGTTVTVVVMVEVPTVVTATPLSIASTAAVPSKVLGPWRLFTALIWYVFSTFLRCGLYGCCLDTPTTVSIIFGSNSLLYVHGEDNAPCLSFTKIIGNTRGPSAEHPVHHAHCTSHTTSIQDVPPNMSADPVRLVHLLPTWTMIRLFHSLLRLPR